MVWSDIVWLDIAVWWRGGDGLGGLVDVCCGEGFCREAVGIWSCRVGIEMDPSMGLTVYSDRGSAMTRCG